MLISMEVAPACTAKDKNVCRSLSPHDHLGSAQQDQQSKSPLLKHARPVFPPLFENIKMWFNAVITNHFLGVIFPPAPCLCRSLCQTSPFFCSSPFSVHRVFRWCREMTQWVKHCQGEDRSSDSQNPCEKPGHSGPPSVAKQQKQG